MSSLPGNSSLTRQRGRRPTNTHRERETDSYWGQQIRHIKTTGCARFGFQNINGVSIHTDIKPEQLSMVLTDYDFDYFGIQELNTHERILLPHQKWQRKFPHLHTKAATNQHSPSTRRVLHGGTAQFLNQHLCLRQISHGQDTTGLGRWIWTLLRGRQGIQVRVISGYRPVDDQSNRPYTVYSQHEHYFNTIALQGGHRNPRLAFYEDLDISIRTWMAEGDQIILGLDANEDIHTGATAEWTTSWGLMDALQHTHPSAQRVATCNKNTNNIPIDGIWITPGLNIKAAGMTGFGQLYPDSDHRILWIDVDLQSLFGFLTPSPEKRPQDSLPVRDPKAMKKYNKYVKQQFEVHRISEKTFSLEEKALLGTFTEADVQTYNNILNIQHDIRRRAKTKCRRFFTSKILYTEELGKIYRRRKLWKLMELKRLNVKVDIKAIRRLMRQVQEPYAFTLSINDIKKKFEQAVTDWKEYKNQQVERRNQFELQVDKRRAQRFGTTVEAQTKQRHNSSTTRSIFKNIKRVMKPIEHVSISTVEYTADNGSIIECLSREMIEQACIAEGQRRFTQAEFTPFLQGSLVQDFGYNANPPATQAVLDGTYQPGSDVSPLTQRFIEELKMPNCIKESPPISGVISTQDHCTGWKRMRLRTGSSPYGPLFCDYIAGVQDEAVAAVDASLSSIPYLVGFSPTQWQEAADVMIPKKKSSRHVQKLRIIVLFDAKFNMVNKRIANDMLRQAQKMQLLPNEAYGGVPGRCATTCTLNKVLALDVIRMERRMATLCSNDAKSCYDRIVHTVASICMQRLGVSSEACSTIFGTLQELNHHVRTAYGERADGYGALRIPLHGVGQGNGAGPAIWLAITIPLINMLRKEGFGLELSTPISGEECMLACFVYVDDVDSIHAPQRRNITVNEITADTQRMLDTWTGGLHATGGMVEAVKSYWYLIDFKWNTRKLHWEYKTIAETPSTLYLRHPGEEPVALTRKEVWEPDPDGTLGTFVAMDGNQRLVIESLSKKINEWADKIRTRQLSVTEGWLSFRSGISMSLRYQLTTSRLSKTECKFITRKLKQAALKAAGLPATYPDSLVYAPREFLGLGLPNLWHIQATLFAEQCLQFASLPTDPTGVLLRNIVEHMRLEMGVSRCPLVYPYHFWHKCATPTQFFPFWEYASDNNLELRDGLADLTVARDNDIFLMQAFADSGISATQLRLLNLCRLHLRVYLLSDLCTGSGRHIDHILFQQRTPFQHHARFRWPPAPKPNAQCWGLWTDTILKCFTQNHHQHPFRLKNPLGTWTDQKLYASTFFSPSHNMIYQPDFEGNYQRFKYTATRPTRNPVFERSTPSQHIPSDVVPTTIRGNRYSVRHTGITQHIPVHTLNEPKWWGVVTTATLPIARLVDAIKRGTAIAVTDGSYKDDLGTAAFTFRTHQNDQNALTFVHMTPGMPKDLTPYRAEVGGIFGIASFLQRLHAKYDLGNGQITVVCDCKGALDRAILEYPPKPKQPDYDLFLEIYTLRMHTPVTWIKHWVKGHQDDDCNIEDVEPLARLNIEMDTLAKIHWQRLNMNRPAPFSLPSSDGIWSLWSHGQRMVKWDHKVSDQIHYNAEASLYWGKKHERFQDMDFTSISMAYKSLSLFYQLRIPKWIGKRLPVGGRIVSWAPNNISNCPRCGVNDETHIHILTCQHPGAVSLVTEWLNKLELWLVQQNTNPDLRFGVISLLRSSFRSAQWVPPRSSDPTIRAAFQQQQQQGNANVMFGWWAKGWAETQQAYLKSLSRRTTGQRWLSRLIKKQWEIAWDLWRHRMEVSITPDSFSLALAHDQINAEISSVYAELSGSTYNPLRRWFRQPLTALLQQHLAFKQDWLFMVQSFHDPSQPLT